MYVLGLRGWLVQESSQPAQHHGAEERKSSRKTISKVFKGLDPHKYL
jgi:hypothetical protein